MRGIILVTKSKSRSRHVVNAYSYLTRLLACVTIAACVTAGYAFVHVPPRSYDILAARNRCLH